MLKPLFVSLVELIAFISITQFVPFVLFVSAKGQPETNQFV